MSSYNLGCDSSGTSSTGGARNKFKLLRDAFQTNDRNNSVTNGSASSPMEWNDIEMQSDSPVNNNYNANSSSQSSVPPSQHVETSATNRIQLNANCSPNSCFSQSVPNTYTNIFPSLGLLNAVKYPMLPIEPEEPRQVKFRHNFLTHREKVKLYYNNYS